MTSQSTGRLAGRFAKNSAICLRRMGGERISHPLPEHGMNALKLRISAVLRHERARLSDYLIRGAVARAIQVDLNAQEQGPD